ncbi:hypothetical protein [Parachitinimonas caeni]|uniref:DUF697 domain-containing protein n=1 Tax=Parachitinimonas caeni TaxID=3031301 RepID=A0ABT7DXV2_9NEIS|nr:hypothetical protein [Parachitinimonas caeni]MDK2124892.1 hypothetical protein [Parachitinimonas caeni]
MLINTLDELEAVREQCRRFVTSRAAISAGAAAVPLPGLDIGTDAAILVAMIPEINRRFGLSHEQLDTMDPQAKRVILIAVTSIGSELIGRFITREIILKVLTKMGLTVSSRMVTRFVPVLGSVLSASVSFAAMKALGNAHVEDCYRVARQALESRLALEDLTVIEGISSRE